MHLHIIDKVLLLLVSLSHLVNLLQVYSMLQGKRDVETVLTMGIMEDVSIIPQPAGGKNIYVLYIRLNTNMLV